MIIFTRSIVNGLFDPLGNICGMLLGGWLPFIIKGYSFFGLSIAGGSWIFYSINRLIQSFKYLQVQSQLCFKEPRIGWQLKMYKFRYLLYCYNCIIFLVCSFLDFPSLPIGGTPLFIIFHPHHIAFFNQRCQYKDCRQFNPDIVSSLQDDSVDKQDDIQLYNSTVSSLFGKQNTKFQQQLRKINFQEGYMPQGTIQVLMSEKKMIFLLNTGSDILRIRHNYLVYALETKETSCHTLERTCLERYVDFIKDKSKANVTNVVGVASTVLSSSVCYTDPIPQVLDPPRRQFGITLGQQNVEQKHVPKTSENRVPQNAPLFTNRWLVKYKGTISTEDFSTNDYSLSGVFTSEFYREELIRIFVGLLYISLTQLDQKIIQALSMLYQQLSQSSSGQFENIEESLRYFFGMNLSPKISNAVTGLCYYSNFTYTNIDADTDIPNLYQSIQYIIKNDIDRQLQQEMQKVILSCFRNAVYYSQQQILMGDDFAQSYVELAEINDDQKDILFSHPNEPQWNHALKSQKYTKIYAVMAGPRVLEYSFQHVSWDVFHLPNYFYKMIWSSIQTDLLVFDATDDERFSVQSLPAALRNLFCEAAGSPFGYPLVEYGQGII
ncbi:Pecanex and transmembrane domain-containing protein [Spironucleus salmonicida]|nr:Pecanex and transmembrane domain-containing protein [Spironucleus salmonicida]